MYNDFFDYLVSTDSLDEFLGYEISDNIKREIMLLANDYNKGLKREEEIISILNEISLNNGISYEYLNNYFKEYID